MHVRLITQSRLIILACVVNLPPCRKSTVHAAGNRMRSTGESSQTSPPLVSHANWAVNSPRRGGRGRSNTTCALDPITSFITGRHTSTQMAFTTEVPPLALRERGYKRRRGREELYCHSKSKQQLESASRTNMTAFCSVEISQPSASLLSRRICQ